MPDGNPYAMFQEPIIKNKKLVQILGLIATKKAPKKMQFDFKVKFESQESATLVCVALSFNMQNINSLSKMTKRLQPGQHVILNLT